MTDISFTPREVRVLRGLLSLLADLQGEDLIGSFMRNTDLLRGEKADGSDHNALIALRDKLMTGEFGGLSSRGTPLRDFNPLFRHHEKLATLNVTTVEGFVERTALHGGCRGDEFGRMAGFLGVPREHLLAFYSAAVEITGTPGERPQPPPGPPDLSKVPPPPDLGHKFVEFDNMPECERCGAMPESPLGREPCTGKRRLV
jgi:hypothetical protein